MRENIKICSACSARRECNKPVPYEGPVPCDLMIIGRNPGEQEDKLNRPFVGGAGKILDQGLKAVNLNRQDVYITNLCKCKTESNRNMKKEEVKTCFNLFLKREFELVSPKVVIVFGSQPNYFLNGLRSVSRNNSRVFNHQLGFKVIPSIHPAAVCYDRERKWVKFLKSMKTASVILNKLREEGNANKKSERNK